VDIKLDLLDIEQCPSEFFSSNAFMGTARCDYESTYVSISGYILFHFCLFIVKIWVGGSVVLWYGVICE